MLEQLALIAPDGCPFDFWDVAEFAIGTVIGTCVTVLVIMLVLSVAMRRERTDVIERVEVDGKES